MNQSNEIIKELQGISPILAQVQKVNVFTVPDGYFKMLAEKISTRILLEQKSHINLDKNNSPQVPEGYFDSLSDIILSKIKKKEAEKDEEEFQKLFPVLYSLKDKNVFEVPANYFEEISHQVVAKIKDNRPAKVISIHSRWWKYAAAAVIAGVITLGSLQWFHSSQDKNEISTYEASFQYKTPGQLDEGITSLTDEEIIKYLEKHGSIMDNDLLTKDLDVNELPSTVDYLINENTLNDYLEKINVTSDDKNTP